MATWTDIPDSVLEPGKPIRSVDALALRDNPVAIAEGASGAPRVQTAGVANEAVTYQKMRRVSPGNVLALNISGNIIYERGSATWGTMQYERISPLVCNIICDGVVRVTLQHRRLNGSSSWARITVNGGEVVLFPEHITEQWVARQVDISVSRGDTIMVQHRVNSSGGGSSQWVSQLRNCRILVSPESPLAAV